MGVIKQVHVRPVRGSDNSVGIEITIKFVLGATFAEEPDEEGSDDDGTSDTAYDTSDNSSGV